MKVYIDPIYLSNNCIVIMRIGRKGGNDRCRTTSK